MKREFFVVILLAGIMAVPGCSKQEKTVSDGIRDAIQQHLVSLNTINLSAMDMKITDVAVNGNTAQAQVEYVPKTGAAPGTAMRVSYSLEKRGEQWVVVKTNSFGGAINHPAPGTNPHAQPGQGNVHGNLPNFHDIISSAPPDANGTPPPGHPPVTTSSEKPKQN
jgi:hypothetical protein